jgi:hypothetical protein
MIIAAVALNSTRFAGGFKSLFKGVVTHDTVVSLTAAVALLQNTVAAVFGGGKECTVFAAAAVFAVLVTKPTEKIDAQRILGNFEVCAYKYEHNMYAVHLLDNEAEIFEIGKGLMMGNAELLYSSKLSFPSDFVKNSNADSGEKKVVKILIPVAFAAAAIVAGLMAAPLPALADEAPATQTPDVAPVATVEAATSPSSDLAAAQKEQVAAQDAVTNAQNDVSSATAAEKAAEQDVAAAQDAQASAHTAAEAAQA